MAKGILGKKIGMTQLYTEHGRLVPVTVIEAGPCTILQVKELSKDKYTAVKLGFDDKKESRTNKPDLGNFKKAKSAPKKFIKEIRLESSDGYEVGQEMKVDIFKEGEFVDVTGITKGKGFQGGMKRWGWHGGPGSHGSMFHRAVGSIQSGPRLTKVTKGHHLPGHMGVDKVTVQNLEILKVDKEKNLLVVRGTVAGHINSYLTVRSAKKKAGISKQKNI